MQNLVCKVSFLYIEQMHRRIKTVPFLIWRCLFLTSHFFSKFWKTGQKPTQTAMKYKIYDGMSKDSQKNFTKVNKGTKMMYKLLMNSLKINIWSYRTALDRLPSPPPPAGNQGKSSGELSGKFPMWTLGRMRELGYSKATVRISPNEHLLPLF